MVEVIDQRGEEIQTNVEQAQEQIGQAVEKARSRRRKKWWCLLVVRKFSPLAISFIFCVSCPCPGRSWSFFPFGECAWDPFPLPRFTHAGNNLHSGVLGGQFSSSSSWSWSLWWSRKRRRNEDSPWNSGYMAGIFFPSSILLPPMRNKDKNLIMEISALQFSPHHYCYRCDRASGDEG